MDIEKIKQNATVLIPTGVALLSAIYLLTRGKSNEGKGLKEIPYPPRSIRWPIFGHMLSMGKVPSKQITQWHKEAGPIYKINMGNQLWIMISDPLLAHDIFVKAGKSTSSRPYHRFNVEIYGRNNRGIVFVQYDPQWKNKRKSAASLLSPGSVDKYGEILEVEADSMMSRLTKIADEGIAINPFKQVQLTSLNIILTLAVAARCNDIDDPIFLGINSFIHQAMIYSGAAGDLGSFVPSLAWAERLRGTEKKLREFVETKRDSIYGMLIQEAIKKEQDSLAKAMYEMKEQGLVDEDDIHVFMSDLIGAGADTVAVSLYWTFAILAQKPEVQKKIIDELEAWKAKNPAGAIPNFHKDREEFLYAICVQKEVMRFRPVTSFGVPHMASEDVIVNGYLIPKGSILVSSMAAMHMNEKFYKNPTEFKPERFMSNTSRMGIAANTKIEDRDQFGFGWGRRICPGIHLAEVELFNFYVRFFDRFIIEPELDAQGKPIPIDLDDYSDEGIIVKPAPYKIRIVHRQK
ncbi:cytochrome P450 [Rhizopus microsporus ATCC 52813]|uniref:Cytochrome P450 n=1 Tax=Rhizopus microsporus ATCC 52813 TaxID=1340429 RepID=A0A2G4SMW5_RHIZD|nr:cytochrome P450 [Rhizopus microsporus ATCC 52813]PHZ10085.1 cytochrome P450 [Rhizopus microsporus ATCC 52813]